MCACKFMALNPFNTFEQKKKALLGCCSNLNYFLRLISPNHPIKSAENLLVTQLLVCSLQEHTRACLLQCRVHYNS